MIETKILGDAVGIQRGDVIDNSETTVLPSLANGVMTGHFKRGRQDKPFKVTSSNYRSLLGHDPSNPSYLAVEDAFKRGISELSILRVGGMDGSVGDGGGGDGTGGVVPPIQCMPTNQNIVFNPNFDSWPVGSVHAKYRVNGGVWVNYVADASVVQMSLIGDFFSTIMIDGKEIIELYGNGGTGDNVYVTPFRSYRGGASLAGAADKPPYQNGEYALSEKRYTTIEFVATQSNSNDLVYLAFGGDHIATSCAIVEWEGL